MKESTKLKIKLFQIVHTDQKKRNLIKRKLNPSKKFLTSSLSCRFSLLSFGDSGSFAGMLKVVVGFGVTNVVVGLGAAAAGVVTVVVAVAILTSLTTGGLFSSLGDVMRTCGRRSEPDSRRSDGGGCGISSSSHLASLSRDGTNVVS